MRIQITSGTVTSLGIQHRGAVCELPEAEATALIRMGRAVPHAEAMPAPQHREADAPVVRRSRKRPTDDHG